MRTAGADPLSLVDAIKNEVHAVNANVPIYEVASLESQLARHIAPRRFNTWLLGLFAAVALLLAVIGLYGVLAYSVSQRSHEIGIRMALGAQAADVLKLVVKQGMKLALIGIAIGLVASFALTRLMASLLYGVSSTDPLTFILILLLITTAALVACWIPARRAVKTDPMVALRCE